MWPVLCRAFTWTHVDFSTIVNDCIINVWRLSFFYEWLCFRCHKKLNLKLSSNQWSQIQHLSTQKYISRIIPKWLFAHGADMYELEELWWHIWEMEVLNSYFLDGSMIDLTSLFRFSDKAGNKNNTNITFTGIITIVTCGKKKHMAIHEFEISLFSSDYKSQHLWNKFIDKRPGRWCQDFINNWTLQYAMFSDWLWPFLWSHDTIYGRCEVLFHYCS